METSELRIEVLLKLFVLEKTKATTESLTKKVTPNYKLS